MNQWRSVVGPLALIASALVSCSSEKVAPPEQWAELSGPVVFRLATCEIAMTVQIAPCKTHGAGPTGVFLDSGRLKLGPADSLAWSEWSQTVITNFSGPWTYLFGDSHVRGTFRFTSTGVDLSVDSLSTSTVALLTSATTIPLPPSSGVWAGPDTIRYVGYRLGYGSTMTVTYVRVAP